MPCFMLNARTDVCAAPCAWQGRGRFSSDVGGSYKPVKHARCGAHARATNQRVTVMAHIVLDATTGLPI